MIQILIINPKTANSAAEFANSAAELFTIFSWIHFPGTYLVFYLPMPISTTRRKKLDT